MTITTTLTPEATIADRAKLCRAVETITEVLRRMVVDYAISAEIDERHP